jgi:hypothetical protein
VWENQPTYTVGWPITVLAGVLNTGTVAANLPAAEHFTMELRVREGEEVIDCAPPPQPEQEGSMRPLAPGNQATRELHIDELCLIGTPGEYTVELTVTLPEVAGASITGAQPVVSFPLELTLPDPPLVARVTASVSYVRGEEAEAMVRVTHFGEAPVRIAHENLLRISLEGEHGGEPFTCQPRPRQRRRWARPLQQGQSREFTIDLAEICPLEEEGSYLLTPRIEVPRSGRGSFAGTLDAASFAVEITTPPATEASDEGATQGAAE